MLELREIRRAYRVGDIETKALNGITLNFREKEFVAILGTSGSGKTTCLNIIGGLDRYDSGELIIKGRKTSDFKEKDWDAYRNNSIGFVFQNYNLIPHQSIVSNVELGMTLSGVSHSERRRRAIDMLERVGLKDHLHKKPSQLSGGQMQRVAIARALSNDPEILLCDEPTGALDSNTSTQIMDLIKEIARDRLVIMVTHDPDIAEKYADRIVRFEDGKVISDSNPYIPEKETEKFSLRRTSMSFLTALKLSLSNIATKKGRTILTAFASSIGIIGIAVILSLSTGFQDQIDQFQRDALSQFPIFITQSTSTMNIEDIKTMRAEMLDTMNGTAEYADTDVAYVYEPTTLQHKNNFTDDYINYLNSINPDIARSIGYVRIVNMNLLRKVDDDYIQIKFGASQQDSSSGMQQSSDMSTMGLSSYPVRLREGDEPYLNSNYDLLEGEYPKSVTDIVLVIDTKNRIEKTTLEALGIDTEDIETIKLSDLVGMEFKLISNNDFYNKTDIGNFIPNDDYKEMYESEESITLRISGVVRQKEDVTIGLLGTGIAYSDELSQMIIEKALDSDIVKAQKESTKSVFTMQDIEEEEKNNLLAFLGGDPMPYLIMVYPENFDDKDAVLEYLDAYNEEKDIEDQIIYTDLAASMSSLTGGIIDGITIVLIAFAGISLVVSLIMIGIITYTSVLERTKEIGILRALGARKKDITRVFDAETCLLGIFSGVLGVGIAYLLTIPINSFLYNMTNLENVAKLMPEHALTLVLISTVLTVLGGYIPAKMAARKDAVEALRTE